MLSQTADLQDFDEIFVWCVWCFSKQTNKSGLLIKNQPFSCLKLLPPGQTIEI